MKIQKKILFLGGVGQGRGGVGGPIRGWGWVARFGVGG